MTGLCRYSGRTFNCVNVYAPQKYGEKAQLWDELTSIIKVTQNTPLVLIGDFNSVLHDFERENCDYSSADSELFSNFLSTNHLLDVPLSNSGFTWYGPANKKNRLDRVLVKPYLGRHRPLDCFSLTKT